MSIIGLVVNNLSELLALGLSFAFGFWAGKLVQKHFPAFHLSPWKWFSKKQPKP